MKFIFFLSFLMLFTSCANSQKTVEGTGETERGKEVKVPALNGNLFKSDILRPGEVVFVSINHPHRLMGGLFCNKKKIPTFFDGSRHYTFLAETYFSKYKNLKCEWKEGEESVEFSEIEVKIKKFPSERLHVDQKKVTLNPKDLRRVKRERAITAKIYKKSNKTPYFAGPFLRPIESKVTSIYGSKRLFNKKRQTQHLGTDFRAATGTPIKVSNRGRVVLAKNLFYSGNVVIVDHGLGIFTIYGHLSEFKVTEGEIIPQGTIVGLAGATGRVTGPHLHWGVLVHNLSVEGDSLVSASTELFSKR
jgi:murein DD-endopeptidase MepM/ murein hydrolase activator NlpD